MKPDPLPLLRAAWQRPGAPLDPGLVEPVVTAVHLWLRSDGRIPIERWMGIGTAMQARRLMRDDFLREAARQLVLQDPSLDRPWPQACALAGAVKSFLGHEWGAWFDLAEAPAHASAVDACLHKAARVSGADIPDSPQGLLAYVPAKQIPETP